MQSAHYTPFPEHSWGVALVYNNNVTCRYAINLMRKHQMAHLARKLEAPVGAKRLLHSHSLRPHVTSVPRRSRTGESEHLHLRQQVRCCVRGKGIAATSRHPSSHHRKPARGPYLSHPPLGLAAARAAGLGGRYFLRSLVVQVVGGMRRWYRKLLAYWLWQHVALWYITRSAKLEEALSGVQSDNNSFAFTTH